LPTAVIACSAAKATSRILWSARFKGLTAVVARPQMGKSWLLTELARRLSIEPRLPYLVGFAESFGESPDLLLRTVVDLYACWLSDAGLLQQAKRIWETEKPNLLPGVAKVVTKIFRELADAATKPAAVVVEEAINGLVAADQRLSTGGLKLPTLSYEQARDLVASVAEISGRPIVLFLDQWEKSPEVAREAKALDSFIHHLDDWPQCHIFLALRPDEPALAEAQSLERSLPETAAIYRLGEMELDGDESARMLAHVRGTVPAAQDQSGTHLLDLVGGFPGVLYQWTGDYQRARMKSPDDLRQVADDAHNYRFSDLGGLLPGLEGDQRKLAIRLALLPLTTSRVIGSLKIEILDDVREDSIDDLVLARVWRAETRPASATRSAGKRRERGS
jgi:hypothetical protein